MTHAPFQTTQWSVVLAVGAPESQRARDALAALCQAYWQPLYVFARRRGYATHDAEDMTQEFFAALIRRNTLHAANPERGRFRSFLLTSFKHFLADEWDKAKAQKRGGDADHVSYDTASAEALFAEGDKTLTPDRLFDLAWARTLLDAALDDVRADYERSGKADLFDALEHSLAGGSAAFDSTGAALGLGMSEGAIRVALHRLRKRYRSTLQARVAATLGNDTETEEELQALLEAL